MESELTKMIMAISLLPLIVITGIFLRIKKRPYNNVLFSIHKIIAFAFIVFSIIVFIRFFRGINTNIAISFLLLSTTALMILNFITGALQSFEKEAARIINILHKISSYLVIICLPISFIIIYKSFI